MLIFTQKNNNNNKKKKSIAAVLQLQMSNTKLEYV